MTDKIFFDGRVVLKAGDCRERLKELADNSVDAVVCDPPYALASIVKRFGAENAAPATPKEGSAGAYARASAGFMGQKWDTGETAFAVEFWREVFRVLKPGGHVVAFSGTRTYHHMAVAIEDAGFEIRDQLAWTYGTGFPKSHNVSKAIDKTLGADRAVIGTETISNDMRNSGHLNAGKDGDRPAYNRDVTTNASPEAIEWDGWGTALKPAWEPICLARKPCAVPDDKGVLRAATVAENVMFWGTGAINTGACRVGGGDTRTIKGDSPRAATASIGAFAGSDPYETTAGRFPANILHDGSAEIIAAFPSVESGKPAGVKAGGNNNVFGQFGGGMPVTGFGDQGSAARFFYSAKADHDDRLGFNHPTVKPVDVMRWLVRLVCRKGGTVIDPFAGTGTTGAAAFWEGCNAILCEREPEYQGFIAKRMALVLAGPDEKKRARTVADTPEGLPLFSAT